MYSHDGINKTLGEYRALEIELHRELMKSCRRYINQLGIVSIIGIIDIVKQETIELERATKETMSDEQLEVINGSSNSF